MKVGDLVKHTGVDSLGVGVVTGVSTALVTERLTAMVLWPHFRDPTLEVASMLEIVSKK